MTLIPSRVDVSTRCLLILKGPAAVGRARRQRGRSAVSLGGH